MTNARFGAAIAISATMLFGLMCLNTAYISAVVPQHHARLHNAQRLHTTTVEAGF